MRATLRRRWEKNLNSVVQHVLGHSSDTLRFRESGGVYFGYQIIITKIGSPANISIADGNVYPSAGWITRSETAASWVYHLKLQAPIILKNNSWVIRLPCPLWTVCGSTKDPVLWLNHLLWLSKHNWTVCYMFHLLGNCSHTPGFLPKLETHLMIQGLFKEKERKKTLTSPHPCNLC